MSVADTEFEDARPKTTPLAEQIWLRIHAQLEHRLGRLERFTMSLFDRPLSGEEIAEAAQLCNALASTLATLGMSAGADLVRIVANTIDQRDLPSSEAVQLSSLLDDTRLSIASEVGEAMASLGIGRHLLVVGPQLPQADRLMWVAITRGLKVTFHENGLQAVPPGMRPPDVVMVTAPDPDLGAARPLIRAVGQTFYATPIIVLCPTNTLQQRLRGVENVTTILNLELHPNALMEEIALLSTKRRKGNEVLTIGRASEWLAAKMKEAGLPVRSEKSVSSLWQSLMDDPVEAIVIVESAFTMSARELIELLRSDIKTRNIGAIVIAASGGAEVEELLRAGADAVFTGDRTNEVLALVRSRLSRRSLSAKISDSDKPDGVLAWRPAQVLIERMLTSAMRRSAPVGLALLELPIDRRNSRDEEIGKEFRRGDIMARYDDRHVVVLLEAVNRTTLVNRMRTLSDKFSLRSGGGRVACLEFPVDGRSLEDLVTGGMRMIERVTAEDGPWVVGADWRPNSERPPDVYILDPDETLGSVLQATMERRGLRVEHETDSLEGLRYLTGGMDRPFPRLILLELEQRGVGGLQFLRQMQASGHFGRMKIIVVSSRTIEGEMRQAFEMGVENYIAKPFSMPLLLHRVQRALDN